MRRAAPLILGLVLLSGCPNGDAPAPPVDDPPASSPADDGTGEGDAPSDSEGDAPSDSEGDAPSDSEGEGDTASDGSEVGPQGPGASRKGGSTPQDCYDRMERAFKTKDFATYYDMMTTESQDELLPAMTLLAGMAAGNDEGGLETYKAILAKYGVDDLDAEPKQDGPQPTPIELFEGVKDRRGLFNEIMRFALSRQDEAPEIIGLEGLKIDGDRATGTIVRKAGGKQERDPALFRKVDGRWYADVKAGGN